MQKASIIYILIYLFVTDVHITHKGVVFYFPAGVKDDAGYLDVALCELKHPPPQLCPMPEGLSRQQVQIPILLRPPTNCF